jgi:predicted protein tyrosine phosphatase
MHLLFVCNQNRLRSPTAAHVFGGRPGIEARSAGVNPDAATPVTRELLEWSDLVFVMEKRQRNLIRKRFPDLYQARRIVCLYIPDEFDFLDPGLITLLERKVEPYLRAL